MPVIASNRPGRRIIHYDLLEEIVDRYGISTRAAHDAIHQAIHDLIALDGEDAVILDREPTRPGLLKYNPEDVDVYYWLTISDETADAVRECLAASYGDMA